MGWCEVLVGLRRAMEGQRVTVYMGETQEKQDARYAEAGMRYLMSRNPADRIAFARELLKGTGAYVREPTALDREVWEALGRPLVGEELVNKRARATHE